jgi:tetratricopeptide (TPR) repeat protein
VPNLLIIVLLLGCSMASHATEYFDSRFEPGYTYLNNGEYEKALEAFNELKTDMPDSSLVDYSIASTFYKKGVAGLPAEDAEDKEGTLTIFQDAKKRFEELASLPEPFLKANAPFNSANCSAQIAKMYHPTEDYSPRLEALKAAIKDFDKVLFLDPDHESAKRNRDHLSYLHKKMLQDAPPEQKQADEGDGGDSENEGEEEQEGEDPSEGESEEKEDSDKDGQEDDSEGEPEEDDSESDEETQQGEQQQSSENGKTAEEANIEAILESLEEINKDEQKNLRRAKRAPQVKGGKWW